MADKSEDTPDDEIVEQQRREETPLMEMPLPELFRSPHMALERKAWSKLGSIVLLLLTAIVLGILSIYWGADHSLDFHLAAFQVSIIDFDNGEVGPFLQQLGTEVREQNVGHTLGYQPEPGSKYDFSMENVRNALIDEKFWFAVVIQSNATSAMNHAYEVGNASYDPTGSVHMLYAEGRGALVINDFGYPALLAFLNDFVLKFAKQKQALLAAQNAGNATALALQAANPIPISFTIFNEAPYVPSTAEAATEIGTIYLIIISFLSVIMSNGLHEQMLGKIPTVKYIIYRMVCYPILYLYLATLYLTLSCIWRVRFDKFYGASGYAIYWMISWISMMAFGLFIDNINNVLGLPYTPAFFVFWVITNVATGFFPVPMLDSFYKWGYAWPLRHNLIASKAILFGTKNSIGLDFGVLISWVAVSLALQPFTIRMQMRRLKKNVENNKRQLLERTYGQR